MSALAMVLAAGMAVQGIGPDKVSGEVEPPLDLSGEWKGIWEWEDGGRAEIELDSEGRLVILDQGMPTRKLPFKRYIHDEGRGKLWLSQGKLRKELGIYKQEGDRVVISIRGYCQGRPLSFSLDDSTERFTLHRVKPAK